MRYLNWRRKAVVAFGHGWIVVRPESRVKYIVFYRAWSGYITVRNLALKSSNNASTCMNVMYRSSGRAGLHGSSWFNPLSLAKHIQHISTPKPSRSLYSSSLQLCVNLFGMSLLWEIRRLWKKHFFKWKTALYPILLHWFVLQLIKQELISMQLLNAQWYCAICTIYLNSKLGIMQTCPQVSQSPKKISISSMCKAKFDS